jgi:hypothetical protein
VPKNGNNNNHKEVAMFIHKINKVWFASKLLSLCGFFVKLGKTMKAFFAQLFKSKKTVKATEDMENGKENNHFRIESEMSNDTGHDLYIFHVSEQVTRKSIITFSSPDSQKDKQTPMIQDLFQIKGVADLWIYPYRVFIRKGHVFTWDELVPKIEAVLRKHLQPVAASN